MGIFYGFAMRGMAFGIRCASFFNPKARLWVEGRRNIFRRLRETVASGERIVWFHAASLGEFEQGRPVIEAFRETHPGHKILLTFFSPSGYEIRKDYPGADYVFYLPADTRRNARRFVETVRPEIAVFIKYEFWANYLKILQRNGTRTFIVSAIFRPDSAFFRWYGGWYRKLLRCFEHIFVQDEESRRLLGKIGVSNVTVAGDTRFDRVATIAGRAKSLPVVEAFVGKATEVLVAGSTWLPDEELLVRLVNRHPDVKFIIAPHEIHPERMEKFAASVRCRTVRYTQAAAEADLSDAGVLFIDTIGILSSVYRYGKYAYIGGGFGAGIHNTLEAATFGLPLAFGPNHHKFREASDLMAGGGAVSVTDGEELEAWFDSLRKEEDRYASASGFCRRYVADQCGATAAILSRL